IFALAATLLSDCLLAYGLYQNSTDIDNLKHSQDVMFKVTIAHNHFLQTAESARNYMSSAMLHPEKIPDEKATFDKKSLQLKDALGTLDNVISQTPDAVYNLSRSKHYQVILMRTSEKVRSSVEELQKVTAMGLDPRIIGIVTRLSRVCEHGAEVLDML